MVEKGVQFRTEKCIPGLPEPDAHPFCRIFPTLVLLLCLAFMLAGCAGVTRRNPLPEEYTEKASVQNIPFARFWGDELPPDIDSRVALLNEQFDKLPTDAMYGTNNFLALSGGGEDGAFGAGLLVGWTASGTRPKFRVVSGISTGALIAPFAFLGPDYDEQLKTFYTTTSTKDILSSRTLLSKITGESFAKSDPLRKLLYDLYDEDMVAAIAAEYKKGRRLFVGTTNLDAGRPVIWNIGAIAASGKEGAGELISDILLASASIPGIFPPVFITVEANGQSYDEIHVDGGTSTQVFLYPAEITLKDVLDVLKIKGQLRIFVIRNARLDPEWINLKPSLSRIAGRSLGVLLRNQGIGDLYRVYEASRRDGVDYNLAYIPTEFRVEPKETFDPEYMRQLFDLGYEMAVKGYPWEKVPYGYEALVRD